MAETVTEMRVPQRPLPDKVAITSDYSPQFTPRELDLIEEHTGRAFLEIASDQKSNDSLKVFAWLKLRRDGHDVSFADMADVLIEFADAKPDPTDSGPSSSSSTSAASGT